MGAPVTLVGAGGSPMGTTANPVITGTGNLAATTGLTNYNLSTAAIGDTTVSTATASQTTRVHRMRLSVAGATVLTIKSGATTLEVLRFPAAGFLIYDFAARPWYVTAANAALVVSNSAAVQVDGVFEFVKS